VENTNNKNWHGDDMGKPQVTDCYCNNILDCPWLLRQAANSLPYASKGDIACTRYKTKIRIGQPQYTSIPNDWRYVRCDECLKQYPVEAPPRYMAGIVDTYAQSIVFTEYNAGDKNTHPPKIGYYLVRRDLSDRLSEDKSDVRQVFWWGNYWHDEPNVTHYAPMPIDPIEYIAKIADQYTPKIQYKE
jgi:hypothetical protein